MQTKTNKELQIFYVGTMSKLAFLLCCVLLASASPGDHRRSGWDRPTKFPSHPNEDNLDKNLSYVLFGDCNITSCNPVHYKRCYEDKVPQLIIHGVVLILGVVFAYFGEKSNP